MKYFLTLLLLTFVLSVQAKPCDWNNPGVNPYTGKLSSAVDSYPSLSTEAKRIIKDKINRNQHDDQVQITKDAIQGKMSYTGLRDMVWGSGTKCIGEVNTSKWKPSQNISALVYCHKEECLIRPSICNNIALVDPVGPSEGSKQPSEALIPEVDTDVPSDLFEPSESVLSIPKDSDLPSVVSLLKDTSEDSFLDKLLPVLGALAGFLGGAALVNSAGPGGSGVVVKVPEIPVVTAVPEPSVYAMILLGLVVMLFIAKRKG
jgi:hypothetical protein